MTVGYTQNPDAWKQYFAQQNAGIQGTTSSANAVPKNISFGSATQPSYDTYEGPAASEEPKKSHALAWILGALAVAGGGYYAYKHGKLEFLKKGIAKLTGKAAEETGKEAGKVAGEAGKEASKFGRAMDIKVDGIKQLNATRSELVEHLTTQSKLEKQINLLAGSTGKPSDKQIKALETAGIEVESLLTKNRKFDPKIVAEQSKTLKAQLTDATTTINALKQNVSGSHTAIGGTSKFVSEGKTLSEAEAKKALLKGKEVKYVSEGQVFSDAEKGIIKKTNIAENGTYTSLFSDKGKIDKKAVEALAKFDKEAISSLKETGSLTPEAAEQYRAAKAFVQKHSTYNSKLTAAVTNVENVMKATGDKKFAIKEAETLLSQISGVKPGLLDKASIRADIAGYKALVSTKDKSEVNAKLKELVEQLTEAIS